MPADRPLRTFDAAGSNVSRVDGSCRQAMRAQLEVVG